MLAADQEIKRLALTAAGREVDEAEVLEFVANNSRFDVFALADAVLAGETGARVQDSVGAARRRRARPC